METIVQIWRHTSSGERYAVCLDAEGHIVAAAGPLHHAEIARARLGDFDSDDQVADDLEEFAEHYAIDD